MDSEWKSTSLGEVFEVKHGFAFKGEYFSDKPTKKLLLTPGNFSTSGGFQNTKPKYYDGPIPQDYILSPGQIVVTMTDLSKESDTLGFAAIIPDDEFTWLHNQRTGLLEFKEDAEVDPIFISYYLRKHEYRSWIIGSATGTTVKHTSPKRISSFKCKLPNIKEQQAISKTLSSLDDKIELNRQTNKTLETMAQALFKSWFVDFDPVIDNALAAGNPIPEVFAERAKLRAAAKNIDSKSDSESSINDASNYQHLFPAEFEFTEEMGWIPSGWETLIFSDLVEAKQGKYLAKTEMTIAPNGPNIFPVWGGNGILGYSSLKTFDEMITLLTCRGSNCGLIKATSSPCWVSNNSFACKSNYGSQYFLYTYFLHEDFSECVTGSAQPQITYTALKNKAMRFPLSRIIAKHFSDRVDSSHKKKQANEKQIESLAKLRDTLLPKLLSGELRIPDAEKLMAEADA